MKPWEWLTSYVLGWGLAILIFISFISPAQAYQDVLQTCLAWNIYFESRSEPFAGQHAVAEVTITRATLSGRNICEEVFLDRQFSWNNGKVEPVVRNKQAWELALAISKETLEQPTRFANGATHYHADYIRKPRWASNLCECARIGRHIFYKPCAEKPVWAKR